MIYPSNMFSVSSLKQLLFDTVQEDPAVITIDDILSAQKRIAPFIRRAPVLSAMQMREAGGLEGRVTLKLELLQVAGSFKARGAMNRLKTLPPERLKHGLVTASGGNHGLAIARTAHVAGVAAKIFLPSNAASDKVAKLQGWNASIQIVGSVWDEANEAALAFRAETGATYVHPFSDPIVVAGQGTLGLEILDDMPDVDTILVAIGRGANRRAFHRCEGSTSPRQSDRD